MAIAKTIDIALGVIFNSQQELLIACRHSDAHQGGLWELPGGKVEAGESVEMALLREMAEEIHISVVSALPKLSVRHCYGDLTVRLQVFQITDYQGRVTAAEGQPLRWVKRPQLKNIDFPAANQPIIDWLLSLA